MNRRLPSIVMAALLVAILAPTTDAKVVNENTDRLPPSCTEIEDRVSIRVEGGTRPAEGIPGVAYTFDNHSWNVPRCALVTVTFVNHDDVRHQFMVHGSFPDGFTLIEVDGPGEDTGSFITQGFPITLMVHCGIPQHQQKGMKAQFLVHGGVGDIPNIPLVSGIPDEDGGAPSTQKDAPALDAMLLLALLALLAYARVKRR